jgi:hypothetical protein
MDLKRLGDLAEVRSGYPFRNRVEPVPDGTCRLVQMKDMDVLGGLRGSDLARIDAPPNYESHLLNHGDVVMAGRGPRNHAVTFHPEVSNAIAAANLVILRPRGPALPNYLAWFLNLPATQKQLRAKRAGSSVLFVPLSELSNLEIPVPSLEMQNRIVDIYKLSLQEEELLARIQARRRTLVDAMLQEVVRRESCRAWNEAKDIMRKFNSEDENSYPGRD